MQPTIKEGNLIIASSIPYFFSKPEKGDIVVFKQKGKLLLKRIIKIEGGLIKTEGDNKADSLKTNLLKRSQILAKVILTDIIG